MRIPGSAAPLTSINTPSYFVHFLWIPSPVHFGGGAAFGAVDFGGGMSNIIGPFTVGAGVVGFGGA